MWRDQYSSEVNRRDAEVEKRMVKLIEAKMTNSDSDFHYHTHFTIITPAGTDYTYYELDPPPPLMRVGEGMTLQYVTGGSNRSFTGEVADVRHWYNFRPNTAGVKGKSIVVFYTLKLAGAAINAADFLTTEQIEDITRRIFD